MSIEQYVHNYVLEVCYYFQFIVLQWSKVWKHTFIRWTALRIKPACVTIKCGISIVIHNSLKQIPPNINSQISAFRIDLYKGLDRKELMVSQYELHVLSHLVNPQVG